MIVGTGQEGFICQEYRQRPYGSRRISQFGAEETPNIFDIEGRAAAGARKAVKPMVTGALALGGAGFILGGLALVIAIRR